MRRSQAVKGWFPGYVVFYSFVLSGQIMLSRADYKASPSLHSGDECHHPTSKPPTWNRLSPHHQHVCVEYFRPLFFFIYTGDTTVIPSVVSRLFWHASVFLNAFIYHLSVGMEWRWEKSAGHANILQIAISLWLGGVLYSPTGTSLASRPEHLCRCKTSQVMRCRPRGDFSCTRPSSVRLSFRIMRPKNLSRPSSRVNSHLFCNSSLCITGICLIIGHRSLAVKIAGWCHDQ